MIIAQGYKEGKLYIIVLSRATNEFTGWQVYLGNYQPDKGETFETAQWESLGSSRNLIELLYYQAIPEIATWADNGTQAKNIQDVLLAIHEQCKKMVAYIEAACVSSRSS